ncbi:MAG: lyase family protein, partial [Candidatus Micrarchaeota archaeon]|nr:lyase family protein [Candidatus Micrarchaeota archaeon]
MDIQDNADILRQKEAFLLLTRRTASVLFALQRLVEKYKDLPCVAYTHLQAAEPTTLGYRFSSWAQDLLYDLKSLEWFLTDIRGKGLKGATGTSASYVEIFKDEKKVEKLEKDFMDFLGLQAFDVATQTYPRKQDLVLASVLSGLAQTLHKIGLDVRLMQMQHEASEPFGKKQVGSSAMPFKRNPMSSERLCSLARLVASAPMMAWENAANNALERTLDDSANRRIYMEQSFLALDEMLLLAYRILSGLNVNEKVIRRRLDEHAPFALTEVLLMDYVKKGASRQEAHEKLRDDAMAAWQDVLEGNPNPLAARTKHVDVKKHVGLSAKKAAAFSKTLTKALKAYSEGQESATF